MTINEAIREAEKLLPGVPAPDDEQDPRWQAIIKVGEFAKSHPDRVWEFTLCWGSNECADLRAAVATILLEHLLEYHFETTFPRVLRATRRSEFFADTFSLCQKFGLSELPHNAKRIDGLRAKLESTR